MKKKEKWFSSSVIKEDQSKTTKNTKHFILNDGTRKAIISPRSINYFDDNEKAWKPIDNSLKAVNGGYRAALGKYTANFSKQAENETVEIVNGTDKISWEYLGSNKNIFLKSKQAAPAKRKSKLNISKENNDAFGLSHTGRAVFSDAEGNIDLDYRIEGNNVKENIIIKEKSDNYHYYFLLSVDGFELKTAKDGSVIEFYKKSTDSGNDGVATPEFIMPAPFMYDANGFRCDDVKYHLEKTGEGSFVFSIEANPEWINAAERVFPVCIDPQLISVEDEYMTVSHSEYLWCKSCGSDGSVLEQHCKYLRNVYYDHIYLSDNGTKKTIATLCIRKSDIDLTRNKLNSAKLIFWKYDNKTYPCCVYIKIADNYYAHHNSSKMEVDITDLYQSSDRPLYIKVLLNTEGDREFDFPSLMLDYTPIKVKPVRKTFAIENNVSAELDILSGNATIAINDISDSAVGASISHVYKPNDNITEYGKNFRLNLDERLVKTSTSSTGVQYTYTDSLGDVHTFDEHFYEIGTDGKKQFINSDISSITPDSDGRLWLNGKEVFRELITEGGLVASARLEGSVNNAEWVEQRLDEEKQLEEQVKSYEDTLCNFSVINKESGVTSSNVTEDTLSSPDSVEEFLSQISDNNLLLSNEEALAYKSLKTQMESLTATQTALVLQKESIKNDAETLLKKYKGTNDTNEDQKNNEEISDEYIELQIRNFWDISNSSDLSYLCTLLEKTDSSDLSYLSNICGTTDDDGTLTKQYDNTQKQIDVVTKQIDDIDAQIELYFNKSGNYTSRFKAYYKEYINLNNQRDKLEMQIPVAYLISDSGIKGFNKDGNLAIVQNKYGKYIVIERKKYKSSGATRISSVYNQDGEAMSFSYNGDGRLSEICNSVGERVRYRYDIEGFLNAIEYSAQPDLAISYATVADIRRIKKVESANKTWATLSYTPLGMLTKISNDTDVSSIAHDNAVTGTGSTVSKIEVKYTADETKLIYDGIKQEIYKINQTEERVDAHFKLVNGKVTDAENYTYTGNLLTKTERVDKSCLNQFIYTTFIESYMKIGVDEAVTYNSFKEPTKVVSSRYDVTSSGSNNLIEQTTVDYVYNDERKLIEKKTTHSYFNGSELSDTTVAVEKYYYNNAGETVRSESYVEGEELKTGVNIEEHVFNDNGIEIKSFSYNSLDPSSKLYTECEVDEKGNTTSTLDDRGRYKTAFDYESDGVTVKTEHLPNGSRFSYGRDRGGAVTAISHSTENGEENSTTQARTLDVITEVKSGNNTVRYGYDEKRRVTSISLNGKDDYVTYAYSDDNTKSEKVTATMANGVTVSRTQNAFGNVTETTCSDRSVTYGYNSKQQLTSIDDRVSVITELEYDDKGNVKKVQKNGNIEEFYYNDVGNTLKRKTLTFGKINHNYSYTYRSTADRALESITVNGNTVRPNIDALGRSAGKTIEIGGAKIAEEKLSYVKLGDHATSMPSTLRFATNGVFGESIQYKYDSMGNIIEMLENGRSKCRYEYDALGRLTREDNVAFAKTTTWAYDNNGNIIARYDYAITAKPTSELHLLDSACTLYTYDDNSDQLMSYGDKAFVYDDIGNPDTYKGKSASWTHGRELTSYNDTTFTYDARGRRKKKQKQNETAITFTYDSNGNLIKQNNGLEFFYDHTGVFAFKYNNFTYFYRKNAQNDVIAILDSTGDTVVKYVYDAWGNHKILDASGVEITDDTHIGVLNPFRYRSYYYDTETKLYFLKTRYYDPEIGRFITIDDISYLDPETINGLNLYAYCGNNPINKYDPSGHFAISIGFLIASILIGAAFGAGISGAIAYSEGERGWDLVWDIAGGAVMGAATGAIIALGGAAGLGAVAGTAVAGVNVSLGAAIGISIGGMAFANATKYSLDCAASDNQWSLGGYMLASVEGAAQGAATFFIANVGGKAGLFNKLANFKTPDVFFTPQYGGINSLRAFVWGSKVLIGETLSKAVLVSGTSALARKLIDLIIPDLY